MGTLRCIAFASLLIFYPTNPYLSLRVTHNVLPVPGEQKLVAPCIANIQCVELSLLNTSQVVEGCGKGRKAKTGPLVENNPESDWERTADRTSHTGCSVIHSCAELAVLCHACDLCYSQLNTCRAGGGKCSLFTWTATEGLSTQHVALRSG